MTLEFQSFELTQKIAPKKVCNLEELPSFFLSDGWHLWNKWKMKKKKMGGQPCGSLNSRMVYSLSFWAAHCVIGRSLFLVKSNQNISSWYHHFFYLLSESWSSRESRWLCWAIYSVDCGQLSFTGSQQKRIRSVGVWLYRYFFFEEFHQEDWEQS